MGRRNRKGVVSAVGMPFRDAYHHVSRQIAEGTFDPPTELHHTHEGSLGNLNNAEIEARLERVLAGFGFGHWQERVAALTENPDN